MPTSHSKLQSLGGLVALTLVGVGGCSRADDSSQTSPAIESDAKIQETSLSAVEDSAAVIPPDPLALSAEQLQRQADTFGGRLEVVLLEIEEARDELAEREVELSTRESALGQRETELRRYRLVSWIVFIVGMIALFLGLARGRRGREVMVSTASPPPRSPSAETPSPAAPETTPVDAAPPPPAKQAAPPEAPPKKPAAKQATRKKAATKKKPPASPE